MSHPSWSLLLNGVASLPCIIGKGRRRARQTLLPWYKCTLHCLGVLLAYSLLFAVFFSPALVTDRLLAPGDAMLYYLPAFYTPSTLWNNLIFAGFPSAADPQAQSWYPLKLLFSSFATWNSFVISAYVLASCITYTYIYVLTKSCFAAFIGGAIYGMSGFMMAHLGHTTIIHGALWILLQILALERLRHGFTAYRLAVSSLAIACSALAHPQIFAYSLGLSIAYAGILGWSAVVGRWRHYAYCLVAHALGLFMAAIQLLPSFELANLSVRSQMSFANFVSYSLPAYQAITLFFPYVFGGAAGSFYNQPYFGAWNQAELTGYVGLLSLTSAYVGCIAYRRQSMVWFWCGVGIVAFILTRGCDSPLARLMYYVPVYNKFRAPSRHVVEMTLAVSVLSGMGIAALQRQRGKALLLKALLIMAGLLDTLNICQKA